MQTQFPKVELPQIPERIYRIEDYGAVKGGEVSNTEAIRKAIGRRMRPAVAAWWWAQASG